MMSREQTSASANSFESNGLRRPGQIGQRRPLREFRLSSTPASSIALAASTAILSLLSPAQAADVLVGGPQGAVFQGDSKTGNFEFFGVCGGPIQSMAQIGDDIFLGDTSGRIYRVSITGQFETSFTVPNNAAAMAVHNGQLLVGGSNQTVVRINPQNGQVVTTFTTPEPVNAMAVFDDFVYISGPQVSIHRADANIGTFTYFTCSCFGPVNALIATENHLFLVDDFNSLWRINRSDGIPETAAFLQNAGQALVVADGEIAVGSAVNSLRSFDPADITETSMVTTPVAIHAMIVLQTPPCVGDLDSSGAVGLDDLTQLLNAFGVSASGDLTGDGLTDLGDLAMLLSHFGQACQ